MGKFGTTELIVIFMIVLLLFGSKKLPAIGQGLGKGIQNFRKSLKGEDEIDITPNTESETAQNEQISDENVPPSSAAPKSDPVPEPEKTKG